MTDPATMALKSTLAELTMTVITLEEARDELDDRINAIQERITELRNAIQLQQPTPYKNQPDYTSPKIQNCFH